MEQKQIAAALVKAQKDFGPALKSATNPHFKSKYADLAACVEAVIDGLNNNGIALIQKQHPNDGGVTVETVFIHESGEMLSAGLLSVPAAKQDPQGYGSALTYARRYSLMAACGIAPEDDDGNAASKKKDGGSPRDGAHESLAPQQQAFVAKIAGAISAKLGASNDWGALEELEHALAAIESKGGDKNMFKVALWSALSVHHRKALESMEAASRKAA